MGQVIGNPQSGGLLSGSANSAALQPVGGNDIPPGIAGLTAAQSAAVVAAYAHGGTIGTEPIAYSDQSSYYAFCYPCKQFVGSVYVQDVSGSQGRGGTLGGGTSEAVAFANPGYVTSTAGTGAYFGLLNYLTTFDLAKNWVIAAGVINKAAPASNEVICGNADSTSSFGFYLVATTTGKIQVNLRTSANFYNALASSTAVFCDSTDHAYLVAIDPLTKSIYIFCDGVMSDALENVFAGSTSGASAPTTSWRYGANGSTTSYAGKHRGVHLLIGTGGLPVNLGQIALTHANRPTAPFPKALMGA